MELYYVELDEFRNRINTENVVIVKETPKLFKIERGKYFWEAQVNKTNLDLEKTSKGFFTSIEKGKKSILNYLESRLIMEKKKMDNTCNLIKMLST